MIQVNIRNSEPFDDLFASIVDNNLAPPAVVEPPSANDPSPQRINHGQFITVFVQEDGSSECDLTITTARVDDLSRTKLFEHMRTGNGGEIEVNIFGV